MKLLFGAFLMLGSELICGAQAHVPMKIIKSGELKEWQSKFVPKDPWRNINGTNVYLASPRSWQFEGKVLAVTKDWILLEGWCVRPLSYLMVPPPIQKIKLLHFTHPVSVGQILSRDEKWAAVNFTGEVLDYGIVAQPPPKP